MKTKFRYLILLLVILFSGTFTYAQEQQELLHVYQLTQHAKAINLSDQQLKQLNELEIDFSNKQSDLISDEAHSQTEIQEQYKKLEDKRQVAIREIITEKQIALLQTAIEVQYEEHDAQMLEHRKAIYKTGSWENVGLSDDQIESLIIAEKEVHNFYDSQSNGENAIIEKYEEILTAEQLTLYLANVDAEKQLETEKAIQEVDRAVNSLEALVVYFETESFVKHQNLRKKLDSKISAPDKIYLETVRTQFLRLLEDEVAPDIRKGPLGYSNPDVDAKLDRLMTAVTSLFEMYTIPGFLMILESNSSDNRLDPEMLLKLAMTYDTEIEELSEEINLLREEDMKKELEVLKEILPENEAQQMVARVNLHAPLRSDVLDKNTRLFRNIAFLLVPLEKEGFDASKLNNDKSAFIVYPSPSNGAHTLELNLEVEDKLTIELLNSSGQVIQIVHNSILPVGKNLLSSDWSKLEGTIFYYRIQGKHGVETVKFVLSR